jgi:hypothetical protein
MLVIIRDYPVVTTANIPVNRMLHWRGISEYAGEGSLRETWRWTIYGTSVCGLSIM